jgi:hypothetical protein
VSRAGTKGTGLPANDQEERKKQRGLRPSPKVTTAPGMIPATAASSGDWPSKKTRISIGRREAISLIVAGGAARRRPLAHRDGGGHHCGSHAHHRVPLANDECSLRRRAHGGVRMSDGPSARHPFTVPAPRPPIEI